MLMVGKRSYFSTQLPQTSSKKSQRISLASRKNTDDTKNTVNDDVRANSVNSTGPHFLLIDCAISIYLGSMFSASNLQVTARMGPMMNCIWVRVR